MAFLKKSVGLEIFENLLSSWPFLKSIEVSIVKSKILSFLKTEFGTFQLQAPGNPVSTTGGQWSLVRDLHKFCKGSWNNFAQSKGWKGERRNIVSLHLTSNKYQQFKTGINKHFECVQ